MPAAAASPTHGRSVSCRAAPAGPAISPTSRSAPTACVASAAHTPTSTRNTIPKPRTGSPRAAATASSRLAKSSGRAKYHDARAQSRHRSPPRRSACPRPKPEDRTEQHVDVGRAVRRAPRGRVDAEEQHAGAEDPGEHRADHDVVGAPAVAEQPERDRDEHRRPEQARTRVDADRERRQRAGERDVTERVGAEHLAAQHDEVADEPARRRDRGPGEERVAHERSARACRPSPEPGRAGCTIRAITSAAATRSGAAVGRERDRRDPEPDRVRRVVREREPEPTRSRARSRRSTRGCAPAARSPPARPPPGPRAARTRAARR